jgi:SAM-dependent methyltransferase
VTAQVEPFTEFASYYDSFMLKCVDYEGWLRYIEKIFRTFKIKPNTILDLACGTGIPTMLFARRGYQMIGIDHSKAMLEVLRQKSQGYNITTYESDIREFAIPKQVDAAICLYDSINYLLTDEDLKKCFRCVRTALAKNGLFVFDMNTDYGLSVFWGTRETIREAGNVHSIWHNTYDEKTKISILYLTCYIRNENRSFEEIHQERAYELPYVQELLKSCDFSEVKFYQHGSFSAPTDVTVRVMVVAR